jgi:hypothetical protein
MLQTQSMKGGKLIAGGADTLVFYDSSKFNYPLDISWFEDPDEIEEMMAEYPVPADLNKKESIRKQIQAYRAVVRMICVEDSEMRIHRVIKHWLGTGYLNKFVGMHTNVWAGNGVYEVNVDATRTSDAVFDSNKERTFRDAMARFPGARWNGLITRYQKFDIFVLSGEARISRLADILRTLLHIDGRFVHFDLHMGNAGVMRDGTTVIHDFGRAVIRDYFQANTDYRVSYPDKSNCRVYRNQLIDLFLQLSVNPSYSDGFGQFEYISKYLAEKAKTIEAGQKFENWLNVSCYDKDNQLSGKFEDRDSRWLSATDVKGVPFYRYEESLKLDLTGIERIVTNDPGGSKLYYMKPVYETRYHQLARIHDILAALAGFNDGPGEVAAGEAAKELLDMIDAPIPRATREKVEEVINKCLRAVHDSIETRWDQYTKEREIEIGTAYWKLKSDQNDYARLRTGWWAAITSQKPAPAAAPAEPAPAEPAPAEPAPAEPTPPAPKNVDSMKPPMTRQEVIAENKIPPPQIPADATADVKDAINGILAASGKPDEEVDDGLGPWTVVGPLGKHKGGTFRRRRLPQLL